MILRLNEFFSGSFTLSNTQELPTDLNKKKPKYLLIMDLDDKDSELRDAKEEYSKLEHEVRILKKWGFGREIPSKLGLWVLEAKSKCEEIEKEVDNLKEEVKNYEETT